MEEPPRPEPAVALGSAFDEVVGRRPSRSWRRRLRGWLSWHLVGLVARLWPLLYMAYCRFVWRTSEVTDETGLMEQLLDRYDRCVALLWHQEVFTVAYAYSHLRPHTLASAGNFGRVITHMLERCRFVVFRGGSSRGERRKVKVLPAMIRHMEEHRRVLYGITVDGSHGPVYRLKEGGPFIARAGRAPVVIVRASFARRIELRTWDRTMIPLPFNRIRLHTVGPYWIPPDSPAAEFKRFVAHMEQELLELTDRAYRDMGEPPPPDGRPGFPEGWQPRWSPDRRGTPFGPHDLRLDDPPPWAFHPAQREAAAPRSA